MTPEQKAAKAARELEVERVQTVNIRFSNRCPQEGAEVDETQGGGTSGQHVSSRLGFSWILHPKQPHAGGSRVCSCALRLQERRKRM
eukprot:116489-Amphidinium_carterae.2